ncbi:LysR substrate-binding domain-containing protein [Arthrobacter sp. NicSoilB8]|uniref:LysR substrate-binding domain-containing protein n=1 Tax=Arthrobacter sp. NicSoilB8 TaxID=2830998 RepID=UPI001CC6D276|nr:LysR substrate-binding domain-containing protein [Arthrobacter sp. NicSoilB8]
MTGTRTRTILNEAREHGIDLRVVVETPHREAVVPLVLEGVGSAFVTSFVARETEARSGRIRARAPDQLRRLANSPLKTTHTSCCRVCKPCTSAQHYNGTCF